MHNNKFKFLLAMVAVYSTSALALPEVPTTLEKSVDAKATEQKTEVAPKAIAEKETAKADDLGELVEKIAEEDQKKAEKIVAEENKEAVEVAQEKATEIKAEAEEQKEKKKESRKKSAVNKVSVAGVVKSGGDVSVEGIKLNKSRLAKIYDNRDYKAIFFDDHKPNALFTKAQQFIALADANGLSRQDFDPELLTKRIEDENLSDSSVAKTDALITHLITQMLLYIGNGREIQPELKLQTYFLNGRPVRVSNVSKAFDEFIETSDNQAVIDKYSPNHPQYLLLRKNLQNYIEKAGNARNNDPVKYRRDIVPGDKDPSVSEIRRRIGGRTPISPNFKADIYDQLLFAKVKEYQKKFGLKENGVITKDFIEDINGYDDEQVSRIKTNMERYRWLPNNIEDVRLEVNLPEYQLHVYDKGKQSFSMGTIVGRSERKTPLMNTRMFQFVLNPYWYVPKEYALRNLLPLLQQTPDYTKLQNMKILKLEKEGWKEVKQSDVNWNKYNKDNFPFMLRQEPGNINVLGPIKMAIVNPHDIFLHSTSEPWLFTNQSRGYSSGCIRVEDPVKLANFIIEHGDVDITEKEFMDLYTHYNSKDGIPMPNDPKYSDKYFKLKTPLPIYLTYVTAIAKEDGSVEFLEDTYSLDFEQAKLLKI